MGWIRVGLREAFVGWLAGWGQSICHRRRRRRRDMYRTEIVKGGTSRVSRVGNK